MASRNCKFRSLVDCYGHFPLKNRFGGDQVPLELNRWDFTLDLQGTTDPVHIRVPKKDIDKRQATIQLFVRVEGEQIMKPTLILRSTNPADNRYEMPPGLRHRKVHFEGRSNIDIIFTQCVSISEASVKWDPTLFLHSDSSSSAHWVDPK